MASQTRSSTLSTPTQYNSYGPNATCRLGTCPVEASVYGYQPSLAANTTFLVLFFVVMVIQIILGVRYRTWWYMGAMILGCIAEILGYGGRIMMWLNPFTFNGFLLQICCIAIGPAFFSAAIYFTISKIVLYLSKQYSRFRPSLYYWIFIPCDLISLTFQGTGGGLSSSTSGSNQVGVDLALFGLSFQVLTLCIFIGLCIDYFVRCSRGWKSDGSKSALTPRFKRFLGFLSVAIVLILLRCAYRIDELSQGYSGPLIGDEGLFIGLEGVPVIIAAFVLCFSHPGPVFGRNDAELSMQARGGDISETKDISDTDSPIPSV